MPKYAYSCEFVTFAQLFLSSEKLVGRVRLTSPPGRSVWQGGILAKMESVISKRLLFVPRAAACVLTPSSLLRAATFETLKTKPLIDQEVKIYDAGYVRCVRILAVGVLHVRACMCVGG